MVRISKKELFQLTDGEIVLLGLVDDSPKYGYEIDKLIQEQSIREWTEIGFSSIYYILTNLEKKKLVTASLMSSEKNRTRKIYAITDFGRKMLQEHIRKKISEVKLTKWQIDIGLAYLWVLSGEETKILLKEYRKSLEETVKGYKNLKQYLTESECPINRLQLAERPIILYQAEITWVDNFLSQLDKEEV